MYFWMLVILILKKHWEAHYIDKYEIVNANAFVFNNLSMYCINYE